jgi:adenylosuccinate lyase
MIERYQRPQMASIWTLENQYATWLEVELAVVKTQAQMGLIPQREAEEIINKAKFDVNRISEVEEQVKHDIIAFVTNIEENVGPSARYFHFGLTSSDVLDTSLALRLVRASELIRQDLVSLIDILTKRAKEFADTPTIGRSHGIHAEPTTFGLKLASFLAEFQRNLRRFEAAIEEVKVGKISGPVGNYSSTSLSPQLEEAALQKLDLRPTPISTQVVPRDIHAQYFQVLALIATSAERLAVEVRHLARTEVAEAEEAFSKGQKGSSAMPHKKNPILSENITGLSRVVRSLAQAALDNVVLWHERDISHSSVERLIAPDATILTDFLLHRLSGLVANLFVKPERMLQNLEITGGLYNSQEILLSLCRSGLSRVEAYGLVQDKALTAANGKGDFRELLKSDKAVTSHLKNSEIDSIFKLTRFSRFTHEIFQRLGID